MADERPKTGSHEKWLARVAATRRRRIIIGLMVVGLILAAWFANSERTLTVSETRQLVSYRRAKDTMPLTDLRYDFFKLANPQANPQ